MAKIKINAVDEKGIERKLNKVYIITHTNTENGDCGVPCFAYLDYQKALHENCKLNKYFGHGCHFTSTGQLLKVKEDATDFRYYEVIEMRLSNIY